MRKYPKRNWNNPYSQFYTPSLKKHLEQYLKQSNVLQKLSLEDELSKLLESTELYIEITNQGFQIQALNCWKNFDDQEDIGAGTEEHSGCYSNPTKERTYADPEIPT
ncbi:hypothetical protein D8674_024874 [Pyrus ussuriensis x Pyrus communis]|uniref:Uncharacterized protein n=1 Tax=Pyrus ussuriensis x Pyrus communis TaxID=2448454 RepID=A0A5N5H992_9ROSA|nr:hypothetical protein D8674_024874 [Pyrus ussuriensis x Pyrus communis]